MLVGNAFTPLVIILWIVTVATLIVELWAIIDAAIRPGGAYLAAGKLTKPFWLAILGVGLLFSLLGSFLAIIALVASLVYLIDVRPRLREVGSGRGGSSHMGPYGPW